MKFKEWLLGAPQKLSTYRHRKKEARKGGFLLPISETA